MSDDPRDERIRRLERKLQETQKVLSEMEKSVSSHHATITGLIATIGQAGIVMAENDAKNVDANRVLVAYANMLKMQGNYLTKAMIEIATYTRCELSAAVVAAREGAEAAAVEYQRVAAEVNEN